MNKKTRRLFIALAIPNEIKDGIIRLQQHLDAYNCRVRWVKREALHITLRFLGDTPEALIPALQHALEKTAASGDPFPVTIEGTGFFPGEKNPRIIWAGITAGREPLIGLAGNLNDELTEAGIDPDRRPFSPHVTIGRIKSPVRMENVVQDRVRDLPGQTMTVREILLIDSRLRPAGPVYTILHTVKL